MYKAFILIGCLLALFSCNTKQKDSATNMQSQAGIASQMQDSMAPLKITFISQLDDSLKPKPILLEQMPKPVSIIVPKSIGGSYSIHNSKGEIQVIKLEPPPTKMLAVLQTEEGLPIQDHEGNPCIMGDGGKSNFTNFTTENGLALDAISCSLMDNIGNLWFGTDGGGVSRYDGKSFTTFSTANGLAGNSVRSIAEDKNGNLWFGTSGGGVSKYDGKSFANYTTAQGLTSNSVRSIAEDKNGNLWFGTYGGGVSRFDGKSFTNYTTDQGLANNAVYNIIEDKNGNMWFGTMGGGLSRFNGKTFTTFSVAQGLANNNVKCVTKDKKGNLWFGTDGGGVSKYDGKSFTTFSNIDGLAGNNVWSISEDKKGNMWFGTNGNGVSRFDGKTFTTFTTNQELSNNNIYSISEDKSGNMWFGTDGGGVSRYNGKSFTTFSTAHGLAGNTIFSTVEDRRGNMWFGTDGGGISHFNGKSFTNYTTSQGLANNNVFSIAEDRNGNMWFGTLGGLCRYNNNIGDNFLLGNQENKICLVKSFTTYTTAQGLANNAILSIAEDKNGNMWFGTDGGGVSFFDGKSFTNYTTNQGLADNVVYSIAEDNFGNMWFGTSRGGVSRYDGKSFTNFNTNHGLAGNFVLSIFEDKNKNIWFGTNGGGVSFLAQNTLNKLQKGVDFIYAKGTVLFNNFNTTNGLADDVVYDIVQDKQKNIFIGTNLGFTVIPGKFSSLSFSEIKDEIEYYNVPNGYPLKDINTNAMCCDKNGMIWAGTGNEKTALVRFDYKALHKDKRAPALVIQNIKVNEENICWYDLTDTMLVSTDSLTTAANITEEVTTFGKELSETERDSMRKHFNEILFDGIRKFYPIPENLILPYKHNSITIDFNAIETGRPQLLNYQYILEGYDKQWSHVTKKTSTTFGNINEGDYTFKVKAQGANGVWSDTISYSFKVLPPWYRTWWAYLIYLLLFLWALRLFSKRRERSLRNEKDKLEMTVRIRTAEVVAEKKKSDDLLLNILPEEVAEELKAKGSADAKLIDEVTVLFTDFKGFTQLSEKLSPKELIGEINQCFSAFDLIMEKHGIEKIKTIGDAYMAAGGLPTPNKTHAMDVVTAAYEIQQFMLDYKQKKEAVGEIFFEVRIGIHTGPVVAGIVGIKKFAYDIWGDTVNTASRIESSGEAGKVNISGTTYELVKDKFNCIHRGKIQAKGKGEIDMYFVQSQV